MQQSAILFIDANTHLSDSIGKSLLTIGRDYPQIQSVARFNNLVETKKLQNFLCSHDHVALVVIEYPEIFEDFVTTIKILLPRSANSINHIAIITNTKSTIHLGSIKDLIRGYNLEKQSRKPLLQSSHKFIAITDQANLLNQVSGSLSITFNTAQH